MSALIFIIGSLIFISYVFFASREDRSEKEPLVKVDDVVDYDGHGNYGRFPKAKEKVK